MTQVSNYDMRHIAARLSIGYAGHDLRSDEGLFLDFDNTAYGSSDVSLAWLPEHKAKGIFIGPAVRGRFDFAHDNRVFGAGIGGRFGVKSDTIPMSFAIDLMYEYVDGMYRYAPYDAAIAEDPTAVPDFKMHQNRSQGVAGRISVDYWFNPFVALGVFLDLGRHWGVGDSPLDTTRFNTGLAITCDILGMTRK